MGREEFLSGVPGLATETVTIREYRSADKDAVLELIRCNTPRYFALAEEEDLSAYLDGERELYYVLLYCGKLVGCGGINFAEKGTVGKLSWDIVHPGYQGRSFGRQLLEYRIKKLQTIDGIRKITVRTSQLAYRFYEKHGFVLTGMTKDYWAEGFDLYAMEFRDNRLRCRGLPEGV